MSKKKISQNALTTISTILEAEGTNLKDFLNTEEKDDKEEWLDLKQASAYARVSPYTVRRWLRTRGLKGRKLNGARCGRVVVHAESLRRFIETQQKA